MPTGVFLIACIVTAILVSYLFWRKGQEPEDVSKAEAAFREGYSGHQTAAGKPVVRYKRQKTPKRIKEDEDGQESTRKTDAVPAEKPKKEHRHHHDHKEEDHPKVLEVEAEMSRESASVDMKPLETSH